MRLLSLRRNYGVVVMLHESADDNTTVLALKADRRDLEIAHFLRVERSFVHKIRKELEKENDNVMSVSKEKKLSTRSDSMRTAEFIHKVKQTIDENRGQSMRSIAKKLHVSEKTIRRNVHEDIRYKSYVIKRGQFISEKSKENCLNRSKRLLNKLKNPVEARIRG